MLKYLLDPAGAEVDISLANGQFLLCCPNCKQLYRSKEGARVYVTGVKVFSATKAKEREGLGELVTKWIRANPDAEIVDKIVTQSSDSEFHCLTITLFYRQKDVKAA